MSHRSVESFTELKEICDANSKLIQLRDELEQVGVGTGSIPVGVFTIDRWSDQYGGNVASYQVWVRENFSELKDDTY